MTQDFTISLSILEQPNPEGLCLKFCLVLTATFIVQSTMALSKQTNSKVVSTTLIFHRDTLMSLGMTLRIISQYPYPVLQMMRYVAPFVITRISPKHSFTQTIHTLGSANRPVSSRSQDTPQSFGIVDSTRNGTRPKKK